MVKGFNEESEKPQFIYKKVVDAERSFEILMFRSKDDSGHGEYEIVGDYTVIDEDEDFSLSEKKIENVISLLNGKDDLAELGSLTKTRVLFSVVPKKSDDDPTKIVFRNHDGEGTSEENAVLTIEKGVIDESKYENPI